MSNRLRNKKHGNVIVWVLLAMLVFGLGGYGARNFGASVQSIGTVGDRAIDLRDYARALQGDIQTLSAQIGQPVSFAQAQTLGVVQQAQGQIIATTALDYEAGRIGISAGDDEVRDRLSKLSAFRGADGQFDRDTYKLLLQREGMTEGEFEAKLRDETARTILQDAAVGATEVPGSVVSALTAWTTETRDFTIAELIASDLPEPVPAPDEAALKSYYDAHPADFTRPEERKITYVWLRPEMLADKVTLDEAALRKSYQDRIGEFVTPEKRLVERLVYPTEEAAKAAKARFDAGQATFEALAKERGLELSDIDLGEVTEADLGAAGAAVFAMGEPGVAGPLPSEFGPALYAMNGIIAAQETTFEAAREELASEASLDQARRLVAQQSENIADLLASGATLEEVAKEAGMELGQIDYSEASEDGIAGYGEFRQAAAAARTEDFPQLLTLKDGGLFALRLDAIVPPALRPMDEVRDAVAAGWTAEETHRRLAARAAELQAGLANGAKLNTSGLVVTRYTDFARNGHLADAPGEIVSRAFALDLGQSAVIDTSGRVFLVQTDAIHAASPDSAESKRIAAAVKAQLDQSLGSDMFQFYVQSVENEAGISLNAAAINAVHAQMN